MDWSIPEPARMATIPEYLTGGMGIGVGACQTGWFWYNGPYSKAGLGWTRRLGVIIITDHFGQVYPAWLPNLLEPVESNA